MGSLLKLLGIEFFSENTTNHQMEYYIEKAKCKRFFGELKSYILREYFIKYYNFKQMS